ncbi:phosphotransferase [Deinococcus detaillensis]|uniref:Phosphotransferase n=1 Tax=Deinococcus detaillensis TaxID=2592048 RepID=A0A553V6B3_9DEIO|nr:phosphotransferase [Deinococcus detaillensis]TSA88013.1 phosphotransferase [Deinococcus detaillensis]
MTAPPFDLAPLLARYGSAHAQISVLQHVGDLVLKVETVGQRYSLRVFTAGSDETRLKLELAWLSALACDTELNIPLPLSNLDGCLITHWTPPHETEARACVLSNWIEGERASRQMGIPSAKQLGHLTAQLHQHARHYPKLWQHYTGQRWDAERFYGPNSWWSRQAPRDLGEHHQTLIPAVSALKAALARLGEKPEHFGLIHADLHFGNLISGPLGLGVIDFAEAAPGYFAFDLALTAGELMDYPEGEQYVESFYAAYQQAAAPYTGALNEVKVFKVATGLAFLAWVYGLPEGPKRQDKLRWVPNLISKLRDFGNS